MKKIIITTILFILTVIYFTYSNFNTRNVHVYDTLDLMNFSQINDTNDIKKLMVIRDTIGRDKSEDLCALLTVLKNYKIRIPKYKYSYIIKVENNGVGVYDDFVLSNDSMLLFRTSFNRNLTPSVLIYYNNRNNKLDSTRYQFTTVGNKKILLDFSDPKKRLKKEK